MQGRALPSGCTLVLPNLCSPEERPEIPTFMEDLGFENVVLARQNMRGLETAQGPQCVTSVSWDAGSQASSKYVSEPRSHVRAGSPLRPGWDGGIHAQKCAHICVLPTPTRTTHNDGNFIIFVLSGWNMFIVGKQ